MKYADKLEYLNHTPNDSGWPSIYLLCGDGEGGVYTSEYSYIVRSDATVDLWHIHDPEGYYSDESITIKLDVAKYTVDQCIELIRSRAEKLLK